MMENMTIPVIAAPMFLISNPKMVIECCKNGVVGTFPSLNQRTTEGFEEWVIEIKNKLEKWEKETGKKAAPFGVNLIVHPTNSRVQADLEICVKHKVPLIITSLGAISQLVDAVHSYGGKVFHDVIKKRHAEKAAEAGVDGLILVCAGAGGHGGTLHPMPFVHEIKSFFKGKVILSGCISNGRDVASAIQMGADFAYMGTRFISTIESHADEEYKKMILKAGTSDIVYTAAVSGVKANFLKPSLIAMGIDESLWANEGQIDFDEHSGGIEEEAKAWKTIWSAGQGVSSIHKTKTVAELVEGIREEFLVALKEQKERLETFEKRWADH